MPATAEDRDANRAAPRPFRAALVNMPFGSARRPSIQLGLLSAVARQAGEPVDCFYFNLDLAAVLGVELYEQLCEHRGHMTGDWLFAVAAFAEAAEPSESYLAAFPEERAWAAGLDPQPGTLAGLREQVLPEFIRRCAAGVDWSRYALVGFTLTFQQNAASLALAREIRTRHPEVRIVFGGSNMEGEMGAQMLRDFPCIDLVVSGGGDRTFPLLLQALREGEDPTGLPGVLSRGPAGRLCGRQAPPQRDLDALPVPDYRPYFERAQALGLIAALGPGLSLPFEGSRGCWWGAKHHCTFCGLNGAGMGYRSKAPERVLSELTELAGTYGITAFEAVDNILDRQLLHALLPALAERRLDFRFFFEIKANISREEIRTLARAGVRQVQPGIESLSTPVLKLMRKGCTMLQNVLCLKWCTYYGIGVSWNLLYGFPGEKEEDYAAQLEVIGRIAHLQPPNGFDRIWLERFSPYFAEADSFGLQNVRPTGSYRHVYPAHVGLDRLAYFFDYEMPDALGGPAGRGAALLQATRERVELWRDEWKDGAGARLTYRRIPDAVLVDRARADGRSTTVVLRRPFAEMLEFCGDRIRGAAGVAAHLQDSCGISAPVDEVREALQEFCAAGLMLSEGDRFLSLPLPANANW